MKTKIKMLIVAITIALSVVGCKKDYPILPEPPAPPKPPIEISTSTISLMVGMSSEISVSNLKDFSVSADNPKVIEARIEGNKVRIEAVGVGQVVLTIRDQSDAVRSARLTITVTPIKFGLMNTKGNMILEANYRFQGPENLHLAPFGALRKEHYLRVPMQKELQQGATVSVEYKTPGAEKQTLQAKIFLIKDKTIYAKVTDGTHLIFQTN